MPSYPLFGNMERIVANLVHYLNCLTFVVISCCPQDETS